MAHPGGQMEISPLGRKSEERVEANTEIARLVKEQLEELNKLLEGWASRLVRRVEQASPHATPHLGDQPLCWAWQKADEPQPPRRCSVTEPLPPSDVLPPWQPHTGGSDSEILLPVRSRQDLIKPATLELPGVIDTTPVRGESTKSILNRGSHTTSRATVGSTRPAVEAEEDKKLRELAQAQGVKKGRTMMQLYDLTSKFDRKSVAQPLELINKSTLTQIVRSKAFTGISAFLIFLNAILIGVQMNNDVVNAIAGTPDSLEDLWFALEIVFTVIFSAELLLRALAERRKFFIGPSREWNMLDLGLILLSVVDLGMTEASKVPNVSFARTLRVLRFTRLLRVVRVMRFFQSFRLMVVSIVNSLAALLWVFLLMLFVMYFFSSIFVHGVTEHFKNNRTSVHDAALTLHFGSLVDALLALFGAICGGKDWFDLFLPLMDLGWFYGYTFVLYIFFVIFGVLNVVVGTFVDTAYQASQRDREYVVQCEVNRNKKYMEDIKTFFHEADLDGSGMLTLEEFETHLQKDKVKAYFQALELDISQARALFMLLDVDGSNEIELDEFIGGCMRMKGDAKSIDVQMLLYENEQMISKWTTFMDFCTERFDSLEAALSPATPCVGGQAADIVLSKSTTVDGIDRDSPVRPTKTRKGVRKLASALAELSRPPTGPLDEDDGRF